MTPESQEEAQEAEEKAIDKQMEGSEATESEESSPVEGEEQKVDVNPTEETPEEDALPELAKEPQYTEPMPSRPAAPVSAEEVIGTLRKLREDVGQISELSLEEGNIVEAFSLAFLQIMESLANTLSVDVSILPREMGVIEMANVVPKGELVTLFVDGRMESFDLKDPENRDLLVDVVSNVMPKFNALIAQRRIKMERRISFLSNVTKELQTIADSLARVD